MRRNERDEGRFRGHTAPERVGSCDNIAEPFGLVVEQRDGDGQPAERHVDLQESNEATDQRVAEPDGAAVVPHDPEPGRQLAKRQAPGEGFHRHGENHEAENHADQHEGARGRSVQVAVGGGNHCHHSDEEDYVGYDVQNHAQSPGGERRRAELQYNCFTCDD